MAGDEIGQFLGISFCVLVFSAFFVATITVVFSFLAIHYAKKNRQKLFSTHKTLCEKCRNDGEKLLEGYASFNQYINDFGLNKTIRCSSAIVSSASATPLKYISKYTNIQASDEDLGRLDYIADYLSRLDEFELEIDNVRTHIRPLIPLLYRFFINKKKLPFIICELDKEAIQKIHKPYLRFLYISPANQSRREYRAEINGDATKELRNEIYQKISKKGHSKTQRSAMTNDLREAIKKRDNYTCQNCGNSVLNEPNLLLEVDHIVPIAKGGKTEASNLQTLCWRCNREKSDK